MILIADSGSTKTDWQLVALKGNTNSYHTIGFNPYHIQKTAILEALSSSQLVDVKQSVNHVFFYGAGCSTTANALLINDALSSFFKKAKIEVAHDMLAVARATCGNKPGLAAILGTGSNSCWYDGHSIVENIPALGYILGDYGSGSNIGKAIVCAYLENEMPQELSQSFALEYQLGLEEILNAVYKTPLPNRFLAQFNFFAAQHIHHPYIYNLVEKCLKQFFSKNIIQYANYQNNKLHFVGSVAFVYQNILKKIAQEYDIEIGKIIQAPIDELVHYHCA